MPCGGHLNRYVLPSSCSGISPCAADQPAKPASDATNRQDSRFGHTSVASVPAGRAAGMQRVNRPERSEGKGHGWPAANQPPTRGFSVQRWYASGLIFQLVSGAPVAQFA